MTTTTLTQKAPHADAATNTFVAEARALLGDKGFTQDPERVEPWLTDWRGRYTGRALGLASPASPAEVAGLLQLCPQHAVAWTRSARSTRTQGTSCAKRA